MTTQRRDYSGSAGSPIKLRTNTGRQTEDGRRTAHKGDSYRQRYDYADVTDADENLDAWKVEKTPNSAVRYDRPIPPRRTATRDDPYRTQLMKEKRRRLDRSTLIIILCLAVIAMVLGWFFLSKVADWWTGVQENIKYGNPRTYQTDQFVNLGDSPVHPDHFIAINLHGEIEVIVMNPLDHTRNTMYELTNVGIESIPVTLSFRDTSGDERTDDIVTIGDSTPYTLVLTNNGKTLVPTQPAH